MGVVLMKLMRAVLVTLMGLLLCACGGQGGLLNPATPTVPVLADTFFHGCAYLDSNGNGEIDADDQKLKNGMFLVALNGGAGFGAPTTEGGCATVTIPGGIGEESWPVAARMEPPEETGYELVGPAEIVLEYPESHADFLFAGSGQ
jgi:hypothetical protein